LAAEFILETKGLTKEFKGFVAVNNVDLKVTRGHIHALIGPNGAGKTTFFNLLTKFIVPTRGTITYRGVDITHEKPAQTARRAFESARPAFGSIVMNLTTEHANGIAVVRVGEARLMYPLLSEFSSAVTQLIAAGERRVVVDLSAVGYVDSATIGCLMDLYRQASAAGGALKLAGVQKRVETMLTMTGAQNFIEVHPDEPSAVKSFGA